MNHTYILQFAEPRDISFIRAILNQEYACDVRELFPGTYLLDTDMSFSYMHRIIVTVWPKADLLFSSVKRFSHRQFPAPADPEAH